MHHDGAHVGVDEAGLGPTLGPLVVSSFTTVGPTGDLRAVLADAVRPPGGRARDCPRIEVGDSKKIHSGPRKLERLEHTVLATLAWAHEGLPETPAELMDWVQIPAGRPEDHAAPWYQDLGEPLPVAADRDAILRSAEALSKAARSAGLLAPTYRADVFSAHRINRELRAEDLWPGGSKNTWATAAVLHTLRDALTTVRPGSPHPAAGWCDKAGGRMAYLPQLRRFFPDAEIAVRSETRTCSTYALRTADSEVEVGFLMKGDSIEPRISWASCLAKYLRELVMRAFNRHFTQTAPGLRPTAGYPEDAKRFIADAHARGLTQDLDPMYWIRDR